MSPPAGPHAAGAVAADAAPGEILDDSEIVIASMKPSGWFTIIVSLPVLLVCGLVAVGLVVAVRGFGLNVPTRLRIVVPACMAIACLRVFWACMQWTGIWYVLTNRRVIRVTRRLHRMDVFSAPLSKVSEVRPVVTSAERMFGVGSLLFSVEGGVRHEGTWAHLARPRDVLELVRDAVRKSR